MELWRGPQRRFSEMFGKIAVCTALLVAGCTGANSIETSSTDQQTPTSTTAVVPATSASTQPTSTTFDSKNVTSETLDLAEGTGQAATFEFQAPVPIANAFDVKVEMPIGTDLDIDFVTENEMTLQIFDPSKAERSCLDGDGLTECLLHYPALEAPTPGTWTATVKKLSTPPAKVTVIIEWLPVD